MSSVNCGCALRYDMCSLRGLAWVTKNVSVPLQCQLGFGLREIGGSKKTTVKPKAVGNTLLKPAQQLQNNNSCKTRHQKCQPMPNYTYSAVRVVDISHMHSSSIEFRRNEQVKYAVNNPGLCAVCQSNRFDVVEICRPFSPPCFGRFKQSNSEKCSLHQTSSWYLGWEYAMTRFGCLDAMIVRTA